MAATIDLDAYFERIHWGGSAQPSYGNLAGLLLAHVSRIPFENLDVLVLIGYVVYRLFQFRRRWAERSAARLRPLSEPPLSRDVAPPAA